MDTFVDVDGIKSEYILGFEFFFFFRITFFIGMAFEVIIDDAGEGSVTYCSGDFFSTLDACIFFVVY